MAFEKLFSGKSAPTPAQESPAAESSQAAEFSSPDPRRENRRTRRVYIAMPVVVKGLSGKGPFEENSTTECVNAHGCLVRLSTAVERGQKVTLVNSKTDEKVECRVVYLGQGEAGRTQAGLEFTQPSEYFWRIAFPPDDWNAAERKKPSPAGKTPRPAR